MNSFYKAIIFLFVCLPICSHGQTSLGKVVSGLKDQQNIISFITENAVVRIELCTPEIIRIRTSWEGQFEEEEPYMVVKYNWPNVAFLRQDNPDHFLIKTDKLQIKIIKATSGIEILNQAGELVSSEAISGSNRGGAYKTNAIIGTQKKLFSEEHFFGFGERMDFVDQRGKLLQLNVGRGTQMPHIIGAYNVLEANYCPVPFFMSTKGYGIFLHNSYATNWDMGFTDRKSYSFEAEGGELDYYFIYGPDFPSILDHYTAITGKSPLLPRLAHGLHAGTYSGGTWGHEALTSAEYVVALVRKYRNLGIPLDILHLDSTWRLFGENGGKGATTFEWRETFKNPTAMFDSLYRHNINMVGLHIRPRFDNGTTIRLLDQAREKGFVYPEADNQGEFVNFFDEQAVDWWWENGVMKIASMGAMFLKTDEGSAFGRKANESDKVGPTGEVAERLHNVFPIAYAKAPFTRFSKYNKMRGMNHSREGYAGIQRYPFIWAGDWPSEWQYFEPVIKAGINVGLSGVGYWSHNMGGFEHNADPELYIRWVQFGMFSPVAHVFGMDHPGYKEPWNYGEQALQIFTQYDKLRYQLIPYLYTNAWKMHQSGLPIMRSLVLANQNDPNTYSISDQYMFGDVMMICPVTTKGAQTRVVYLPEGNWFDYWTGQKYVGNAYYNVLTPLAQLPIFVKGGAIIPMQEEIQYDNKKDWGTLTFEIFPSESGSFDLYEDDGLTDAYSNGIYSITEINSTVKDNKLRITLENAQGKYEVPERDYILKVHLENPPASVNVKSGKKEKQLKKSTIEQFKSSSNAGWYFDENKKLLWIKCHKGPKEEIVFNLAS